MKLFKNIRKQVDNQARKRVKNQKPLEEKEIDLGLMTLYRTLMIALLVITAVVLYIGWTIDNKFLMFVSTVPFCVSIFYYRRFAAKRDEIVYNLVNTDKYSKKENKDNKTE